MKSCFIYTIPMLITLLSGSVTADDANCIQEREAMLKTGVVFYNEIIIDRPVEKVWPELFNYEAWQVGHTDARHTRIKGEENKVGEIVEILKTHDGAKPYYAETIRIRPFKNLVWKVYLKEGCSMYNFVDFGLEDAGGGKTSFNVSYYAQMPVSENTMKMLRDKQTDGSEGAELLVGSDFLRQGGEALKRFMESQP